MYYGTKIIGKEWLTDDVIKLRLEKPKEFQYFIGQAIELSIDILESFKHFAPFTLTSTYEDDFLEIIVKVYKEREGLTYWMSELSLDSKIIISEAWDSYIYKGQGVFFAAGSGITPFIPMIRNLSKMKLLEDNKLIYANKKQKDIILKDEFKQILGNNFINILSKEVTDSFEHGRIDKKFIKQHITDINKYFYICGPESFNDNIKGYLIEIGINEDKIQVSH